jgi:flagellar biosynthesis GTPase FlhF
MHEIKIIARTTTAALDIIEDQLGPESVILHTQSHPRGVLMCVASTSALSRSIRGTFPTLYHHAV